MRSVPKLWKTSCASFTKMHGAQVSHVSSLLYLRIPDLTGFSPEGLIGRTVLARKAVVWSRQSSDSGKEGRRQSPIAARKKIKF